MKAADAMRIKIRCLEVRVPSATLQPAAEGVARSFKSELERETGSNGSAKSKQEEQSNA